MNTSSGENVSINFSVFSKIHWSAADWSIFLSSPYISLKTMFWLFFQLRHHPLIVTQFSFSNFETKSSTFYSGSSTRASLSQTFVNQVFIQHPFLSMSSQFLKAYIKVVEKLSVEQQHFFDSFSSVYCIAVKF